MRPELNVRNKVLALERRKKQLDALIVFIKTHPLTATEGILRPLNNRPGLYFPDYAIIRPLWVKGRPTLRLEEYPENWFEFLREGSGPFDLKLQVVCADVSRLSDKKVFGLLDKVHRQLVPEDYEDEDEPGGY
jgi:hypothetical protein